MRGKQVDKDQFEKAVKSAAFIIHTFMKRLDELEEQIEALDEKFDRISGGEGGIKAGSTEPG